MPSQFKRPVILLGEGARGCDLSKLYDHAIPILTSWQASDLLDNDHELYFGRPGVYGQRCANKVLFNADLVVALGCRLSVWTIGHSGLRKDQTLVMVDVDEKELARFPAAVKHHMTVEHYLSELGSPDTLYVEWFEQCVEWRETYPWFDFSHKSKSDGCINAYEVMHLLQPRLRPDEVIVTDMGVALAGAFQVLKVKPPQRLMTSGGLGEMGIALPAAVGASFARGKGEVLCLHCDGGMMLNLQELSTIWHHSLPVKLVVLDNDGYQMIKSTQRNLGMVYSGVSRETGISLPNFRSLAQNFGFAAQEVYRLSDLPAALDNLFSSKEPYLLQIATDPEQVFSPKLQPIVSGGQVRSPSFEELSP